MARNCSGVGEATPAASGYGITGCCTVGKPGRNSVRCHTAPTEAAVIAMNTNLARQCPYSVANAAAAAPADSDKAGPARPASMSRLKSKHRAVAVIIVMAPHHRNKRKTATAAQTIKCKDGFRWASSKKTHSVMLDVALGPPVLFPGWSAPGGTSEAMPQRRHLQSSLALRSEERD